MSRRRRRRLPTSPAAGPTNRRRYYDTVSRPSAPSRFPPPPSDEPQHCLQRFSLTRALPCLIHHVQCHGAEHPRPRDADREPPVPRVQAVGGDGEWRRGRRLWVSGRVFCVSLNSRNAKHAAVNRTSTLIASSVQSATSRSPPIRTSCYCPMDPPCAPTAPTAATSVGSPSSTRRS